MSQQLEDATPECVAVVVDQLRVLYLDSRPEGAHADILVEPVVLLEMIRGELKNLRKNRLLEDNHVSQHYVGCSHDRPFLFILILNLNVILCELRDFKASQDDLYQAFKATADDVPGGAERCLSQLFLGEVRPEIESLSRCTVAIRAQQSHRE